MIDPERLLKFLLRIVGAFCLLAVVAVFAPTSWLVWCNDLLGLDPLPETPVVEYLARSVSAFYVILGGLLLVVARDPRRNASVISYLAVAGLVFSMVILFIDMWVGLPLWWSVGECLSLLPLCIIILVLQARMSASVVKETEG